MDSPETVNNASTFGKLCLDDREAVPFDLSDGVQYFKEVLQAITAFSDFLIAHRSLLAVALRRTIFRPSFRGNLF